ncbi:YdaS family helix-turn-helix protein [Sphingomonas bacterium]|uniref:transcriptional regulator n=1 Tax=Sphingomonas bacterium TaxID=1895847 RepID=UPI0015765030|nr:YdaS family helix-turn-helix protein [Sphingomonas bacterium]
MGIEATLESPFASAVRRVGSQSAYARLVGRSQAWVYAALRDGKPLPAEHVLTVERETGISRHDLRPDLYPRESVDAAGMEPAR